MGDKSNSRVDPELIAPLSKLRDLVAGGTSNANITLSGELTAKSCNHIYAL